MCETLNTPSIDLYPDPDFASAIPIEPTDALPAPQARKRRSRVNRYLGREMPGSLVVHLPPELQPPPIPDTPPFPITIIHAAAHYCLPDAWHTTFTAFSRLCQTPLQIEYILIVDDLDRHNLGVFSGFFKFDGVRSLKSVFGSFRIVLNRDARTPEDRFRTGLRHSHPKSVKVAVSNVQTVMDQDLEGGWDVKMVKDMGGSPAEWALKGYPDEGRFVRVGYPDQHMFVRERSL